MTKINLSVEVFKSAFGRVLVAWRSRLYKHHWLACNRLLIALPGQRSPSVGRRSPSLQVSPSVFSFASILISFAWPAISFASNLPAGDFARYLLVIKLAGQRSPSLRIGFPSVGWRSPSLWVSPSVFSFARLAISFASILISFARLAIEGRAMVVLT